MSERLQKKLSVIIVNWKSEQYLRACLPSVFAGTTGLDYEVIVVDSASPGTAVADLEQEFPEVRFVKSSENIGFGRANNLGYTHSSGDLLLFLNPDTVIIGDAISRMVQTIDALPKAGILGCKLLNTDRSVQISAIQPFPTILNQMLGAEWLQVKMPRCQLWRLAPLFATDSEPVRVQGVSGACLLIRRNVFATIGQFSPEYFMYAEDVDLCHKAALGGWDTWFTPAALIIHHGGGSSRQRNVSTWSVVVQQEAKYAYLVKFRGPIYARVFRAAMGLTAAIRLALLTTTRLLRVSTVESNRIRSATAKWTAILRWSVVLGNPRKPRAD
jgi:GT2 family glycosyltransferase